MGAKPIIKSSKLHHVRRVVLERQKVEPHDVKHARWKADFGKIGAAAVVVALAGSAQASPGPVPLEVEPSVPVPAAEVAIAPVPEMPEPAGPRFEPKPAAPPIAAYAERVSDLKPNPYVQKREPKRRMLKPKAPERVSDLKPNPYE